MIEESFVQGFNQELEKIAISYIHGLGGVMAGSAAAGYGISKLIPRLRGEDPNDAIKRRAAIGSIMGIGPGIAAGYTGAGMAGLFAPSRRVLIRRTIIGGLIPLLLSVGVGAGIGALSGFVTKKIHKKNGT